jgi:hypothetical protein
MIIANHLGRFGQLGPVLTARSLVEPTGLEPEEQTFVAPLRVFQTTPDLILEPEPLPDFTRAPTPDDFTRAPTPDFIPAEPQFKPPVEPLPLPVPLPEPPPFIPPQLQPPPQIQPTFPEPELIVPALGPPGPRSASQCPLWVWFIIGGGALAAGYFILR